MLSARLFIPIILLLTTCNGVPVPSSIKICHKSDKNFSDCLKSAIEGLKYIFKTGDVGNGIKMTPINDIPMEEEMHYGYDNIFFVMKDLKSNGSDDFILEDFKATPDPFEVEFTAKYKPLTTVCNFTMEAPDLGIKSEGYILTEFKTYQLRFFFSFKKTADGKMRVNKNTTKMNLFDVGNIELVTTNTTSNIFMTMIKHYIKFNKNEILKSILPINERRLKRCKKIANELLSHFDYDDILPE